MTSEDLREKAQEQSKLLASKTPKPKKRKQNFLDNETLPEFKHILEGRR